MYYCYYDSPVGRLMLAGQQVLEMLDFTDGPGPRAPAPSWILSDRIFKPACFQLDRYFSGTLQTFDLDFQARGTPFQEKVWKALVQIPYGQTTSYSGLAQRIGHPKACRAVGMANGKNPIAIIIPCHRVIGKDGRLTGFGGGLDIKKKLLDLERRR